MLPSFGWSTVGAEQNDPDTLNNLLFGPIEITPSFNDLFPDPMEDSSSFGFHGTSRDEDNGLVGNDSSSPFILNDNLLDAAGRIGFSMLLVDRLSPLPNSDMEGNVEPVLQTKQ